MGIVELQNVLILMILGLVICGVSILKRRLLRLSADLSEKALRRGSL